MQSDIYLDGNRSAHQAVPTFIWSFHALQYEKPDVTMVELSLEAFVNTRAC